jgi:hypothetical protein
MAAGRSCLSSNPQRLLDSRDANSISPAGGLGFAGARKSEIRFCGPLRQGQTTENELHLGILAKCAALLLLAIALAACAGSDDGRSITYADDRGVADQPFPDNYRAELLAFMKTYLNNPVGVHDAAMAEPVQRTVGGRLRYISCLHFAPRESDGSYREVRERAILYVNGRLDHVVENASEICAGAVYAPFSDLEKLTR